MYSNIFSRLVRRRQVSPRSHFGQRSAPSGCKVEDRVDILEMCDSTPEKLTQTLAEAGDKDQDWHPFLAIFQKDPERKHPLWVHLLPFFVFCEIHPAIFGECFRSWVVTQPAFLNYTFFYVNLFYIPILSFWLLTDPNKNLLKFFSWWLDTQVGKIPGFFAKARQVFITGFC